MNKIVTNVLGIGSIFVIVLCVTFLSYGGYCVARWWNWKWSYELKTKVLIEKAMVDHVEKYHNGELK